LRQSENNNIIQSHAYFQHHPQTINIMKNKIYLDVYEREYKLKRMILGFGIVLSCVSMFLGIQSITGSKPIFITFIISLILYKLCTKKILKDARNSVYSSKNRFLFLDISKNPLNYSFVENEL